MGEQINAIIDKLVGEDSNIECAILLNAETLKEVSRSGSWEGDPMVSVSALIEGWDSGAQAVEFIGSKYSMVKAPPRTELLTGWTGINMKLRTALVSVGLENMLCITIINDMRMGTQCDAQITRALGQIKTVGGI